MNTQKCVESPLVAAATARLVDTIGRDYLISMYQESYNVDVAEYFVSADSVKIYECEVTGYRFYYPFELAGKESLYRQLEATSDGKYQDDKWEYRKALTFMQSSSLVLDVGCGKGAFVKLANEAGHDAFGLELNSASAAEARQNGLKVSAQLIGEHTKTHRNVYDAVCSFQVLEHIAAVREFIQDCISVVRPGGLIIFGVPNNQAFVGYDRRAALNMPPHHMGLWTERSLRALPTAFPMDLKSIAFEPLKEIDWYAAVMERRYLRNNTMRSLYYKLGLASCYRRWVRKRAYRIPGHTILAIYEKRR